MAIHAYLSGSTGLVGSHILATLANTSGFSSITTFGRRAPPSPPTSATFTPLTNSDSSRWKDQLSSQLSRSSAGGAVFFSALGTTRAKAGGLEAQRKIDHDLPVSLATGLAADKHQERKVFVLISSAGASTSSLFPYSRMKGDTEAAVEALEGLAHVVILRPGLIVGTRRQEDSRPTEYVARCVANFMGKVLGNWGKDFWAQDAEVIARAAVSAGVRCAEGGVKERVWVLGQSDIVRLGRTEWGKKN
ncbi:hypothetical protein ANO11243_002640 [Dothideomycetidae sp. 11243]|nr:hypothetical protein ANO11243_002640 [fungal sp. No.11243]